MIIPETSTPSVPPPEATAKTLEAPGSQSSFDQGAKIRPCSSQANKDGTLPVIPKVSRDSMFIPPTSPLNDFITTFTAPSGPDSDDPCSQK